MYLFGPGSHQAFGLEDLSRQGYEASYLIGITLLVYSTWLLVCGSFGP